MFAGMTIRYLKFAALVALTLVLSGCIGVSYYAQSLNGHLDIVSASQPIDSLLEDDKIAPEVKDQLAVAREIRQFAVDRLSLPDNDSYRNYVDTHRDYVTWSVFAAPELSLNVHTWCFPVVGCVPYRGYFSKDDATRYAEDLSKEGLDVHVGGVPAYSTLGWTEDPLLNTMLRYGEAYLAGTVFHELSHQRLYLRGDAEFNEAFAVAVEQTGTVAWLVHRNDEAALRELEAVERRNSDFLALVAESRDKLANAYSSNLTDNRKRTAKSKIIEEMRAEYRQIRDERWNGYEGYDHWFSEPINNAKLATISVYNDLVPDFTHLLELCSGDYGRFFRAVEQIGKLEKQQRRIALRQAKHCE